MKNLSWKGRGQGHVSNFYIVDLENFNTASQSSVYRYYQQTRRRSACGLHLRRSSASWLNAQVCYTMVDCNLLTPLLRFFSGLVQVVPTLVCSSWQDFDWHVASRGPSAVVELLVIIRTANSMRNRVYETVRCPSDVFLTLSMGPQQQTRCCRPGGQEISIVAAAPWDGRLWAVPRCQRT